MRQAIINVLDILVWILGALIAIGGIGFGIASMNQMGAFGLVIMVGGLVYAVLIMGMFFLFIGMHNYTKRTAEAVERLTMK